jgi:hypothetical protein
MVIMNYTGESYDKATLLIPHAEYLRRRSWNELIQGSQVYRSDDGVNSVSALSTCVVYAYGSNLIAAFHQAKACLIGLAAS